jgi:hypothetical protein
MNIVKYFMFDEMLNTKGRMNISFVEFWNDIDIWRQKRYFQSAYHCKQTKKNMTNDLKICYEIFCLYFGSIQAFSVFNGLQVLNKYKPKCVLDPTMGWGGRLLACHVAGVQKYIGIDTNTNLSGPYENLVKEIGTNMHVDLRFEDALKVDYKALEYDMVLTSPPYYNLEIYSHCQKRTRDEWTEMFYKPLFQQLYNGLAINGILCLNIPMCVYENICVPLFGDADDFIQMHLVKRNNNYREYIYCWIKNVG